MLCVKCQKIGVEFLNEEFSRVSAVRLEPNMVLKWKFRVIWQKFLQKTKGELL